ncbi:MAG: hypothetical protein IJF17_05825 [Thermoguttaceae bacterium]|nr:hypothetical protein [Thermoguttaceae bacterium]
MMRSFVFAVLFVLVSACRADFQTVCGQETAVAGAGTSYFTEAETQELHRRWMEAGDQGRNPLVEEIGEEGAERLAKERGWTKVLGKEHKTPSHRQGFDQVWKSADGHVHVIEAKGGTSPLGTGYGFRQGTPEWAVRAAEDTLRSGKAGEAEKQAARMVLKAAEEGKMSVHVVRTEHVLGKPKMPKWESMKSCTPEAKQLAGNILRGAGNAQTAAAKTESQKVPIAKGAAKHGGKALKTIAKGAAAAGVSVDVGLRCHEAIEVEQKYHRGEINGNQRAKAHVKNGAGMAGGMGGAAAGAYGGAAVGATIGSVIPGPGTAIGGFVGGVCGAIGGYFGGETAAEAGVDACWK